MKVATFTVRASLPQSEAWNRESQAEGFHATGQWLARAADAYLRLRTKAGLPLPLAWRRGRFRVRLEDGAEPELRGWMSPPFGLFRGSAAGPGYQGSKLYSLVYLAERRIVATFKSARECKALGSEIAPTLLRSDPLPEPAAIVARHVREAT